MNQFINELIKRLRNKRAAIVHEGRELREHEVLRELGLVIKEYDPSFNVNEFMNNVTRR